jgi:hypothetical protein
MNKKSYTVCIICNDDRVAKWGYMLSQTGNFSRVFIVRSRYDVQEILPGNIDGSLVAPQDLPDAFDGIFFHSSNADLWRSLSLEGTHVFEFNTPGDPRKQEGVIPIRRQTAPSFDIKPKDIEELYSYIDGTRKVLPLCCTEELNPQILPSMLCLFYLYFLRIEKGEQIMWPSFWHETWENYPASKAPSVFNQEWKRQLEREWQYEWRIVSSLLSGRKSSIEKLLQASLTNTNLETPSLVNNAYVELRDHLGLPDQSYHLPSNKPDNIKSVVALSDQPANHALAVVLSHLWGVPYKILEFSESNAREMQRDVLLVISESQTNFLKKLRLLGFSGAVLVISTHPFQTLKQRHRVLRFGHGSHESFSAPWDFEALLPKLSELTPLAPENLQLLRKEVEASSRLCDSHIDPCRKQLDLMDGSGQVDDNDIETLENTVSKLRADLPLACHALITIGTEQDEQPLQIQEHFQVALTNIQSRDAHKISCGVKQFRQVFSKLQHYVMEAW